MRNLETLIRQPGYMTPAMRTRAYYTRGECKKCKHVTALANGLCMKCIGKAEVK